MEKVIKVLGVGGCGCHLISEMIDLDWADVELIAVNTDCGSIEYMNHIVNKCVLIGPKATKGLGAHVNPELGKKAAIESADQIMNFLKGAKLMVVVVGLGGGTGSGASPVISKFGKKEGILTVAIVTLPFSFEGKDRLKNAKNGLKALKGAADLVITIPNELTKTIFQDDLNAGLESFDNLPVCLAKVIVDFITGTDLLVCDRKVAQEILNHIF